MDAPHNLRLIMNGLVMCCCLAKIHIYLSHIYTVYHIITEIVTLSMRSVLPFEEGVSIVETHFKHIFHI